MGRHRLSGAVAALLLLMATLPASAGPARGALAPAARDKCAVCGMFVAKYPNWACAVRFADGSDAWFDGAKDLFKYSLDLRRYAPRRNRADVRAVLVKDYYTLALVDAREAYFVIGSDVHGPMGDELIPFAGLADAKAFLQEHGGKKIIRAGEVTPALLKSM